jgi:hypothetical protein
VKIMVKTSKPRRDGMVRVTFTLPVGEPAAAVSVVGDFNDWDPLANPLRIRANRTRSARTLFFFDFVDLVKPSR